MIQSELLQGILCESIHLYGDIKCKPLTRKKRRPGVTLRDSFSKRSTNSSCISNIPAKYQIFFIPGNPGCLIYYEKFFKILHECCCNSKRDYRVELHAVAHAGHHLSNINKNCNNQNNKCRITYSLEEQNIHQAAFIKRHADISESTEIMIIGHSIGAYMIGRITELLSSSSSSSSIVTRIKDLILLMPFVKWRNLPLLHRCQLRCFQSLLPFSKQLALLSLPLIPNTLLKVALSTATPKEYVDHAVDTIQKVGSNFLSMGVDEIQTISNQQENMKGLDLLGKLRFYGSNFRSAYALYTLDDNWAPIEDIVDLKKDVFPSLQYDIVPNLVHSFSLDEYMSRFVAAIIARQVNPGLRGTTMPMSGHGIRSKL